MSTHRKEPRRQVSEHRRGLYYSGMFLTVVGLILFLSTFVRACANFGDFTNFDALARSQFGVALAGMVMMAIGQVFAKVGRGGLAGSGVVLDPEQAREDLEPFSRMAGGMVKDALDEAGMKEQGGAQQVVKVRCPACKALNDEHDKFCGQCGGAL